MRFGQNLAISITEAQLNVAQHGGSAQEATFSKIDLFLTIAFTVELLLNGFANWLLPFLRNGWSLFDVVIVALSIASLSVAEMPVRFILLLRCCRVLRIFGKLPSAAKIFAALFHSLVPMTNSFFIIFVIAAICKPLTRTVGSLFITLITASSNFLDRRDYRRDLSLRRCTKLLQQLQRGLRFYVSHHNRQYRMVVRCLPRLGERRLGRHGFASLLHKLRGGTPIR